MSALGYGEAALYAVVQGLTEFLPVSSSGHLRIAHLVGLGALNDDQQFSYDILLHGASLLAMVIAFRREIRFALRPERRLWTALAIAVIPTGLAGLLASPVYRAAGRSWWIIGAFYLVTATLLTVSEQRSRRLLAATTETGSATAEDCAAITWRQATWVGGLQLLAPFAGVSRSGSTIAGGLWSGLRPAVAVAFSFLVGIPLIAAAAAKDLVGGGLTTLLGDVGSGPLLLGFVLCLAVSLGAIALLRLMVQTRRFWWFAIYCLILALVCFGAGIGGAGMPEPTAPASEIPCP